MPELHLVARGFHLPVGAAHRRTRQVDLVAVERDRAGRVRASTRISGGDAADAPREEAAELLDRALDRAATALRRVPHAALQSVYATVRGRIGEGEPAWYRSFVVGRLETVVGPVLAGAAGPAGMPPPWSGVPSLPATPGTPERGWDDLPVLLAPPVAAVVATALRLALGSAGGTELRRRLAGRVVLPGLTVREVPVAIPPGRPDDAGTPAHPVDLVERGRFPAPADLAERQVWDHDLAACRPAPVHRVEVGGPAAPVPEAALELLHPVERLQRYHPDGSVWLTCLARTTDRPGRPFLVELRGRPVTLLRTAVGCVGPAVDSYTDDEAGTPAVLLASPLALARTNGGRVVAI